MWRALLTKKKREIKRIKAAQDQVIPVIHEIFSKDHDWNEIHVFIATQPISPSRITIQCHSQPFTMDVIGRLVDVSLTSAPSAPHVLQPIDGHEVRAMTDGDAHAAMEGSDIHTPHLWNATGNW